jgi:hypothetical protein
MVTPQPTATETEAEAATPPETENERNENESPPGPLPPEPPPTEPEPAEPAPAEPEPAEPVPAEPVPAEVAPVEPAAIDEERAPGLEPEVASTTSIASMHERFYLRVGAGIGHCPQSDCNVVPMGGTGALEVGWRARYVAFGAIVFGGGGRGKAPNFASDDEATGTLTFLFIGPKFAIHPAAVGIVDPHLDFGLGWSRFTADYDVALGAALPFSSKYSRGAVLLGGGLDVVPHDKVAIGPDFTLQLPFAGEACFEQDNMETCAKTKEIFDTEDGPNVRGLRRSFPRIWTVTIAVRIAFGAPLGG